MERRKKFSPPAAAKPQRREATVRVNADTARVIQDGNPWIFQEALRGYQLPYNPGSLVDVIDSEGNFLGRAICFADGNLVLRMFSTRQGDTLNRQYLQEQLSRAVALRKTLLGDNPTACYRLLSGDSEGVPAVSVDRYGSYLLVCFYSELAEAFRDDLVSILAQMFSPAAIYLQRRFHVASPDRPRPGADLVFGEAAPPEVVVTEGNIRFVVDVSAPAGTGIYPDMRLGRQVVAELSAGRDVLNCFSYTGAFSVVAAMNGAASVVSVDNAARAHGRARRNFSENKLDEQKPEYEFITGDAFATMARYTERRREFDLVILDPPTFSSNKGRPFTALKDYAELVAAALKVIRPDGYLCLASNAAKMPLSDLERALGRGSNLVGRRALITHRIGQPADYPMLPTFLESSYLKFFAARIS